MYVQIEKYYNSPFQFKDQIEKYYNDQFQF